MFFKISFYSNSNPIALCFVFFFIRSDYRRIVFKGLVNERKSWILWFVFQESLEYFGMHGFQSQKVIMKVEAQTLQPWLDKNWNINSENKFFHFPLSNGTTLMLLQSAFSKNSSTFRTVNLSFSFHLFCKITNKKVHTYRFSNRLWHVLEMKMWRKSNIGDQNSQKIV